MWDYPISRARHSTPDTDPRPALVEAIRYLVVKGSLADQRPGCPRPSQGRIHGIDRDPHADPERNRLVEAGSDLRLLITNPTIRRLVELTGIDDLFSDDETLHPVEEDPPPTATPLASI